MSLAGTVRKAINYCDYTAYSGKAKETKVTKNLICSLQTISRS